MSKHSKKLDLNQLAKRIVDEAIGEIANTSITDGKQEEVVTDKRGAVGGKKRSNNMTKEQRVDAARFAALARWKKSD